MWYNFFEHFNKELALMEESLEKKVDAIINFLHVREISSLQIEYGIRARIPSKEQFIKMMMEMLEETKKNES